MLKETKDNYNKEAEDMIDKDLVNNILRIKFFFSFFRLGRECTSII